MLGTDVRKLERVAGGRCGETGQRPAVSGEGKGL